MECKRLLHNNSTIDTRNYVAYYMDKVFIKIFPFNGENEIENVYLLLEHIISND